GWKSSCALDDASGSTMVTFYTRKRIAIAQYCNTHLMNDKTLYLVYIDSNLATDDMPMFFYYSLDLVE
ncbi:hypothetical protein, partial [Acinetobacter sp. MN12]